MIAYVWRLTPTWPESILSVRAEFLIHGSHRCSFLRCSCSLRARFSASMISINFLGSFSSAASSARIRHSASWGHNCTPLFAVCLLPRLAICEMRHVELRALSYTLKAATMIYVPHIPTKKSRGATGYLGLRPRDRDVAEIISVRLPSAVVS